MPCNSYFGSKVSVLHAQRHLPYQKCLCYSEQPGLHLEHTTLNKVMDVVQNLDADLWRYIVGHHDFHS